MVSNKFKSVILSGIVALSSFAAPFSSTVAPSLSATAAGNDNYARLLQYSLYFYDANMCGDISGCGISWRKNCHTNDEVPGGFHDAGDHAMFGLPQGYTASTLGWSYYEFKDAFVSTGQADHLKMITDHFCDFFKRSTKLSGDSVSNFLYQKGDGNEDHGYWGPPETQGSRKMYWTSNGASDIAAEYAAALAANYKNFGNKEDLTYAKALYKFSKQYNQCATEGPYGFYNSNGCADEQAWAAAWLYIASGEQTYLNDLKSNLPKVGWVHGWNDAHLGADCLYGEITDDWSAANGYISSKASGSGYMFLDKWGSARINCSMQFTALVATKHGAGNYKDWAAGQMNYILGNNPANTCFVTGFASNSAKNAHHRAASGYTSYEQFNMNGWNPDGDHMNPYCAYGPNSHTLIGALVGGPCDAGGSYHDNMADYICNEVAIDYNAGLVGAAAGLYHFYKSGSIDKNIEGVTKIYSSSSISDPDVTVTTTSTTKTSGNSTTSSTTTTKYTPSTGNDYYEIKPNTKVIYDKDADDKMIGWDWEDFDIPATEKVKKVEVNISANGNIGKWQGAFGSSTKVAADQYWTMSKDMSQTISGNSGTITWDVPSATADIIQYKYGGQLKFGTWWIDCGNFTVDSIKVFTDGSGSSNITTTTKATTTTTSTTRTTSTTTKSNPSSSGSDYYEIKPNTKVIYDKDADDKMIGWDWEDFDIPATEKVKKVEVNISANGNIGKWQGAFGSSTKVAADQYWTMSKDMSQTISGNSGTITWDVPSATADIIQYKYGGQLKFGTWWIDCGNFTVDSIKVFTDGSGSSNITTTTKATTTTTTTKKTTTSTSTTTKTTTEPKQDFPPVKLYGDTNCDNNVNMADAVLIMQYVANGDEYGLNKPDGVTPQGYSNGDCLNPGDGLTNGDALIIQEYTLDLVPFLPRYEL